MYDNIKWFKELSGFEEKTIGRKATRICQLHNCRVSIPRGFVITNAEYFEFLQKNDLKQKISNILEKINYLDPLDIKEKSLIIKDIILKSKISDNFRSQLAKAYQKLGETSVGWLNSKIDEYVAIRSSIICEESCIIDIKKIEDEGGNLNIKGLDLIIANIKECWASLFSENILIYAKKKNINLKKYSIAIIIQKMIDAKESGIIITSKNIDEPNISVIEAVFGIGGRLLLTEITPDHYETKKHFFEITNKRLEKQEWKLKRVKGENTKIELNKKEQTKEKLDKLILQDLTTIAKHIENYFGVPQKIEFAISKKDIYILNSEPTNFDLVEKININTKTKQQKISSFKNKLLLTGVGVSKGIINGNVKIINDVNDYNKIDDESIIVSKTTTLEMYELIKRAKGVITDLGSAICNAAIVSQKLNKPCIVNTKNATKILSENQKIQIDGTKGEIYSVEEIKIVNLNNKEKPDFKDKIKLILENTNENKTKTIQNIDIRNLDEIDLNKYSSIKIPFNYIFSEQEIKEISYLSKKEIISKIREKLEKIVKNI
jgi:pyruvate, water dikinase